MQPGGFMQAARWSLGAQEVESRSGEFRLTGADEAATIAASEAFAADIAAALGEDFHYTQATDNLEARFIADKKKGGLGGLIGVVVAVVVAIVATPAVSAWVAGAAEAAGASVAAGSAWAGVTATTGAGIANVAATSFITGTVSSAAGQLASTGKVDLDAAFRNGLVSGLTSGITNAAFGGSSADSLAGLSNQSGTLQPVAGATHPGWADQLLGIGARSVVSAGIQSAINGSSFETALRDALVGDLAAFGANRIGTHLQSVERALAHASLGAIAAELTGKDAASGAIGALTSALAAQPIDEALGLTGETRKVAVTALAMLSGGIVSDALGYDPVTAANAALNEVTNNYLKHSEIVEKERRKAECQSGDSTCRKRIESEYAARSQERDHSHENCADAESCRAVRQEIEQDMGALGQRARELEAKSYTPAGLTAAERNEAFQISINLGDAAKSYEQVWRQFRQVSDYSQWTRQEKDRALADALLAVGGLGMAGAVGRAAGAVPTGTGLAAKESAAEFVSASGGPASAARIDGRFETIGLQRDPMTFPDGVKMIRQLENAGLSHDEAIQAARGFITSGSTLPVATPLDFSDKLVKVVPAGGQPSATTGYWMRESELATLLTEPANLANKLGLPPGMQVDKYNVYQIAPLKGAMVFESKVAPTSVDGMPNTAGGAMQTIVVNRNQFTPPVKIDSITVQKRG